MLLCNVSFDTSPMLMQWLVFRKDGSETAAAWAQKAAEATATNSTIGDGEFMDMFEPQRRLQRRQAFIRSILQQTMKVQNQSFEVPLQLLCVF